jgi:hypothetical protein
VAELGKDDAIALSTGGLALAYVTGELEGGEAMIDRALALNPNLTTAWYASGWVRAFLGETDLAIGLSTCDGSPMTVRGGGDSLDSMAYHAVT